MLLFSACPWGQDGEDQPEPPDTPADNGDRDPGEDGEDDGEPDAAEGASVIVFYADSTATYVVPVLRQTDLSDDAEPVQIAEQAFTKLTEGPPARHSGLSRTVPEETALRSVSIEGGSLSADFSEELTSYGGGSTYTIMLMSSILATAGAVEGVERVELRVGGSASPELPEWGPVENPMPAQLRPNAQSGADVELVTVWQRTGELWVPVSIPVEPNWRSAVLDYFNSTRRRRLLTNPVPPGVLSRIETSPGYSDSVPPMEAGIEPAFDEVVLHCTEDLRELPEGERRTALTALVATLSARDYTVTVAGEPDAELTELANQLRQSREWLN